MGISPSGPRRRPAKKGFTLIELLVAITLLGILLKLALPSFVAWIHNTQVRTVAEALQNGLRTAQAEAVRQNRPVVMAFTNSATTPVSAAPWTVAAGGINWWAQTVPQFTETAGQFVAGGSFTDVASGVTITPSVAGTAALCFNSNGRVAPPASGTNVPGATCSAMTSPLYFLVSQPSADRSLRVYLNVGGQVRMCDPTRSLSTSPDGCPP